MREVSQGGGRKERCTQEGDRDVQAKTCTHASPDISRQRQAARWETVQSETVRQRRHVSLWEAHTQTQAATHGDRQTDRQVTEA